MRTRGDLLSFAIAFALRGARKLVRGFREELTEEERYRVANDVVDRLSNTAIRGGCLRFAAARKRNAMIGLSHVGRDAPRLVFGEQLGR